MSVVDILNVSTSIENCHYYLQSGLHGNTSINMAFNSQNLFSYSNDWLYLIWVYYSANHPLYGILYSKWLENKTKPPTVHIPGNSILVSSSFSSGTAHGYVGIFEIIAEIKRVGLQYDNYIVHANAQDGVKHIIAKAFPHTNLIIIEPETVYNLQHLTLIPIKYHSYHFVHDTEHVLVDIVPVIQSLLLTEKAAPISKLAVIKTRSGQNLTAEGVFNDEDVQTFCKMRELVYVDPKDVTETVYFNTLYAAETIVFSWGTTHFKGLLYISDECKQVTILVKNDFIYQYEFHRTTDTLVFKYKNANIKYMILERDSDLLTLDPF